MTRTVSVAPVGEVVGVKYSRNQSATQPKSYTPASVAARPMLEPGAAQSPDHGAETRSPVPMKCSPRRLFCMSSNSFVDGCQISLQSSSNRHCKHLLRYRMPASAKMPMISGLRHHSRTCYFLHCQRQQSLRIPPAQKSPSSCVISRARLKRVLVGHRDDFVHQMGDSRASVMTSEPIPSTL